MHDIGVYESNDGVVRFAFSHSDAHFTTGVMTIKPHCELPKHNRPLAVENLFQVAGTCVMRIFSDDERYIERTLTAGECLQIPQGQYHVHANPYDTESITLFKAVGDITAVMDALKKDFVLVRSL